MRQTFIFCADDDLFNYFYLYKFIVNTFVLIDTTRRIAPLLRHGSSSYRRDDEDDDAATVVKTISLLSQNFMMVVQFKIESFTRGMMVCISYVLADTCDCGELTCDS